MKRTFQPKTLLKTEEERPLLIKSSITLPT